MKEENCLFLFTETAFACTIVCLSTTAAAQIGNLTFDLFLRIKLRNRCVFNLIVFGNHFSCYYYLHITTRSRFQIRIISLSAWRLMLKISVIQMLRKKPFRKALFSNKDFLIRLHVKCTILFISLKSKKKADWQKISIL